MRFTHSFHVRAPQAEVAGFHAGTRALMALTPPLIPIRLHRVEAVEDGSIAEFTLRLGPVPVRWLARHRDVTRAGFTDEQEQGPFRRWVHRHRFLPVDDQVTEIVDEIEFELRRHPLWGPVGLGMAIGLPLLFAYRAHKTRKLLASPRRQASARS